jgi:hypothetical protein
MRRVYLCSELDAVARRGPEHARVDREKRELEEAIATRYEAVAASARYKARYHADLQAAEALVRMPEEGAAEAAAMRVHLDSSLAEPVKRRRQQNEEAVRQRAQHKEFISRMRSDKGTGPSGHSSSRLCDYK